MTGSPAYGSNSAMPESAPAGAGMDVGARAVAARAPLLEVRGLTKAFGGVQALRGVDFDVRPGEVHGLVGANGAGKSTLIRTLAGVQRPDGGTILIDGSPVEILDPQHATRLGLNFIHQELNQVPKFSALENLVLGLDKPTRAGLIDWVAVRRDVAPVVERLGMTFSLDTPVEQLSVAERWLIAIGHALVHRARLIAMDEPTASLSAEEVGRLFGIVRELAHDGIAVIYVSHRLDEIIELCDRTTVLKDGQLAASFDRSNVTKEALITAIAGGEIETTVAGSASAASARPVLEVRSLRRLPAVRDVSFTVHEGEILGLGGLVGSGRTEVARLVFGADRLEAGEISLDGRPIRLRGVADAVRLGIGLVPEERRSQGLVLRQTVAANLALPHLARFRIVPRLPLISLARMRSEARQIAQRLQIKAPSVTAIVGELSGGNQQKVVIGKWLGGQVRVLILDEPTRGVDVGARAEIHRSLRELASSGTAILVISSDEEELPGLCDRVLVMVEGAIAGELRGPKITRQAIRRLSYAHTQVGLVA